MDKLKRTITRACLYYHPDKQNTIPGAFDQKQIYLRTQISKILTNFLNTMKLPEERKAAGDDSTDEDETPTPDGEMDKTPEDGEPTPEFELFIQCEKCEFIEKNPEANFCSKCGDKFKKDEK